METTGHAAASRIGNAIYEGLVDSVLTSRDAQERDAQRRQANAEAAAKNKEAKAGRQVVQGVTKGMHDVQQVHNEDLRMNSRRQTPSLNFDSPSGSDGMEFGG